MYHEFQNILLHAARVRFIDGGARKSDPDDCDDDHFQCCFFLFFPAAAASQIVEWVINCLYGKQLYEVSIRIEEKWDALNGEFPTYCRYAKCKEAQMGAEG